MRALLLAGTAAIALGLVGSNALAENDQGTHQNLRSTLTQMLQKSGYTDIRVAPSSFVVRAKDGSGNPVVMTISPDEFTEVAAVGTTTGSTADNAGTARNGGASTFVSVPDHDDLSSKVVGLDVYNNDNKDIGTIKDIALNPSGRATAYIVSVGGFLGIATTTSPSARRPSTYPTTIMTRNGTPP